MYTAILAFRETDHFFFFNFPVNLLNNPNLDGSETVFVRASFSDIEGTAAGGKKDKTT